MGSIPGIRVLLVATLIGGGCASAPRDARDVRTARDATVDSGAATQPSSAYRPLDVANACFVESVNYYDHYNARRPAGDESWARLLHWSDQVDTLTLKSGHAVTVFTEDDRLWVYDINQGVVPLATPVERRGDLLDVTPEIFAKYPRMNPVLTRYHEDYPHRTMEELRFTPGGADGELADALEVAERFSRLRPVRVVEFSYPVPGGGGWRAGAAAVFPFGSHLCIYSPATGTSLTRRSIRSVDDLGLVKRQIAFYFPGAKNVRWHKPAQAPMPASVVASGDSWR